MIHASLLLPNRPVHRTAMKIQRTFCLATCWLISTLAIVAAEPRDVNYDEAKVGSFTLPDPLVAGDGTPIKDAGIWIGKRRPELLELFRTHVYGRTPAQKMPLKFQLLSEDKRALDGLATRKEVRVFLTGSEEGPKMDLLLYIPNAATKPVPAFLGLNFYGNQCVSKDPGIALSEAWMRANKEYGIENNRATEATRGVHASRWLIEKIVQRGYATVTAYYGDLEPDHAEGWKDGIRAVLKNQSPGRSTSSAPTAAPRGAPDDAAMDDWGAIGAWAWGLSRALDYLETDPAIDAKRVAVHGHSRLGKTSLWAGAQDERFAIVISNDSGEGGAALARRNFGETTAIITKAFPHWFCDHYDQYAGHAEKLPVDQHELIALIAPRPVYVASAEDDKWADPHGEFLSAKNAEPVFALFGKPGLGIGEMPSVNQPVGNFIGYHMRSGKHDINEYDWDQYLNFADRHFQRTKP
jgi:hypothetical protein